MTGPTGARVHVITTGGTIASRPGRDGAVRVAVQGHDLVSAAGVRVTVEELMLAHSFDLTVAESLRIAERARAVAGDPEVAGVVVTHGTDTMEETAYLTDLLLEPGHTVVFTGAQRHAGLPDSDGPRNIADAVRVAAEATGLGAVIVMAQLVHAARHATKSHTLAPDAYSSPGAGPVGHVHGDRLHLTSRPVRSPWLTPGERVSLEARVDIVPAYLGADGVHVAASRQAGARGIVLEAMGAGNATPGLLAEIRTCLAEGMLVLVSSRCRQGPATPIYESGGVALERAGAIFAGTLTAPKARLLLAAALSAERDPRQAAARLAAYLGA
ncbi:asparaginase [Nonomuraea sp. NPDC003754]